MKIVHFVVDYLGVIDLNLCQKSQFVSQEQKIDIISLFDKRDNDWQKRHLVKAVMMMMMMVLRIIINHQH